MNTLALVKKFLPDDAFCWIHHSYIVALARVMAFYRKVVDLYPVPADRPYNMGLARIAQLPMGQSDLPQPFPQKHSADAEQIRFLHRDQTPRRLRTRRRRDRRKARNLVVHASIAYITISLA
jgi:hypothetical protein